MYYKIKIFYIIGKFDELPYDTKSPPGRIAQRRKGKTSPRRPAAGGESAAGRFLFKVIQEREQERNGRYEKEYFDLCGVKKI